MKLAGFSRNRRRWLAAPVVAAVVLSITATSPRAATLPTPIKHVLVIYQENHTFDNVLGKWCTATGRCAGLPAAVVLKGGTVVAPTQATDIVPDIAHDVISQQKAIDSGAMDGWAGIKGCGPPRYTCITYYTPQQIPNLAALATKFAVSDTTYSEALSPSWGGHMYAVAASLDGFRGNNPQPAPGVPAGYGWGCDSKKVTGWASTGAVVQVPSCVPDSSLGIPNGGAFRPTPVGYIPTIMDRLGAASLSWRMYAAPHSADFAYNWATCPSFAECLYSHQHRNVVPTDQILADAKQGTLPNYGLILPGPGASPESGGGSQHNRSSMLKGDNWIGEVLKAVEASPEWSSTAVFITYDDCGCFYDHVLPPINPDGTRAGLRLPLVIASPYARAGFVDHTPASTASILAFVEHTFGLSALTNNDAIAYDYAAAFNYTQPPQAGIPLVRTPIPAGEQTLAVGDDPT